MANRDIENRLRDLAQGFVTEVLQAFRDTFSEVVGGGAAPRAVAAPKGAPARGRATKDGRRSPAETEAMARKIAAFVAGHPTGIRVEPMGKALGLKTSLLNLPIAKALKLGLIAKKGERRATTYLPTSRAKSGK